MNKLDYKKRYKNLYMPRQKPLLINVPPIQYVCIEGVGDPNTSPDYQEAIALLYGLSYTIKMSKMTNQKPDGYFEYVVPLLEGFWWSEEEYFDGLNIVDKNQFHWKSVIRLPEFVDEDIFEQAKQMLAKKKSKFLVDKLKYEVIDEGLCVQMMHKGSFDNERESIKKIYQFIDSQNLQSDISSSRLHHEIYLSDFRRTKTENLKTVIRHPVKRIV